MNCGERVSNEKIVPTSIGQGFLASKAANASQPGASLHGGKVLWRKIRGNAMHIFIPTFSGGIARLNRRKD